MSGAAEPARAPDIDHGCQRSSPRIGALPGSRRGRTAARRPWPQTRPLFWLHMYGAFTPLPDTSCGDGAKVAPFRQLMPSAGRARLHSRFPGRSHVSVAAIRFAFTVRRAIPAPVRSRTRCRERPARPGPAGAPARLPVSPAAAGTRRDAVWLHRGAGPVRRHDAPDGRAPRSREDHPGQSSSPRCTGRCG